MFALARSPSFFVCRLHRRAGSALFGGMENRSNGEHRIKAKKTNNSEKKASRENGENRRREAKNLYINLLGSSFR